MLSPSRPRNSPSSTALGAVATSREATAAIEKAIISTRWVPSLSTSTPDGSALKPKVKAKPLAMIPRTKRLAPNSSPMRERRTA